MQTSSMKRTMQARLNHVEAQQSCALAWKDLLLCAVKPHVLQIDRRT